MVRRLTTHEAFRTVFLGFSVNRGSRPIPKESRSDAQNKLGVLATACGYIRTPTFYLAHFYHGFRTQKEAEDSDDQPITTPVAPERNKPRNGESSVMAVSMKVHPLFFSKNSRWRCQ
jgi:hypothetical protein